MVFDRYTEYGVLFQDELDSRKKTLSTGVSVRLLYPAVDGGEADTLVNPSANRVNNANFDGWRITGLPFHYGIGEPKAGTFSGIDGVCVFGGKQGAEPVTFRLEKMGWMHWPTKAFNQLGSDPTYNRANLSRTTTSKDFGGVSVDVGSKIEWDNIWQIVGGGSVGIRWNIDANRMKEEVFLNQAARDWLEANPPITASTSTYFTAVFQLDPVSGRKIKQGETITEVDDVVELDDSNGVGFELLNISSEFFGFMPISDSWVNDGNGDEIEGSRTTLRKRVYRSENKTWLAVAIRADELFALPDGELILDPTINEQIAASAKDGSSNNNGTSTEFTGFNIDLQEFGKRWGMLIFDNLTIPQGATIDTADLELYCISGTIRNDVGFDFYGEDIDDSPDMTTTDGDITNRTQTTATVNWTEASLAAGFATSPEMKTIAQEVVDRGGWVSGNSMGFIVNWASDRMRFSTYDGTAANAAKFNITYTTGGATGSPAMKRTVTVPYTGRRMTGRF